MARAAPARRRRQCRVLHQRGRPHPSAAEWTEGRPARHRREDTLLGEARRARGGRPRLDAARDDRRYPSRPSTQQDPPLPDAGAGRALGGAPVVPSVTPGFTDSHYFREHGVESYGFVPFILAEDEEKTVHGTNERVSVENLRGGVRRMVTVLRALPSGHQQ